MGKWVRTHENWVKPNSRTGNVTTTKSSFGKLHSNKSTGQTNRVRINRWLLELYQARLKCVESVQHTDYACEILSLHHGKAISRRSRYIYRYWKLEFCGIWIHLYITRSRRNMGNGGEMYNTFYKKTLYPMSQDSDGYDVLTPGHFLSNKPLYFDSETKILDVRPERLLRFRHTQHKF